MVARKASQLTDSQKRQLGKYLESIQPALQNKKPSLEEVAAQAQEALGFDVTAGNVVGAVTAGWVPAWAPAEAAGNKKPEYLRTIMDRLTYLSDRVDRYAHDLKQIEEKVEKLLAELSPDPGKKVG